MCTGCRCASRCGGGRLAWMGRVGCRVPARALKIQLVSRGWGRLRTHENVHRGGTFLQMHLLVLSSMHPMVQLSAIARICPPRNRARACSRPARPPPTHVSRARGGEGGAASPSVAFCHPRKSNTPQHIHHWLTAQLAAAVAATFICTASRIVHLVVGSSWSVWNHTEAISWGYLLAIRAATVAQAAC